MKWDLSTAQLVKKFVGTNCRFLSFLLEGHKDVIYRVICVNDFIFSSGADSKVIQWNKISGEIIRTFTNILNEIIYGLSVNEDSIFIGTTRKSNKDGLYQIRISDGALLRSFDYVGSVQAINVVKIYNQFVFSGGFDSEIRQWLGSSGSLVQVFLGKFHIIDDHSKRPSGYHK
jgi:WD40 repeat protein